MKLQESSASVRFAVLMTCHNRREKTVACLQRLAAAAIVDKVDLNITLVDDGSTDGTADAVRKEFPSVNVVVGSGDLYWAGGMSLASKAADIQSSDFVFLLNDDTMLRSDALTQLLTERQNADIIVGRIADPATEAQSYGGVRSAGRFRPVRFEQVLDDSPIHTFNANAVLIRRAAWQQLEGLDSRFSHGFADYDLGLRAGRRRITMTQTSRLVGDCPRNSLAGGWQDPSLGRLDRLRELRSVKGLPPRDWARFTARHAGALAPLVFASPYIKAILRGTRPKP